MSEKNKKTRSDKKKRDVSEKTKEICMCGPDITDLIIEHLNEFVNEERGDLSSWPPSGARTLQGYATRNTEKIVDAANKITGCPKCKKCEGTVTFGGKCISQYHIRHILIMVYIAEIYGTDMARIAGQINEGVSWYETTDEGEAGDVDAGNEQGNADLTFNELAIGIAKKLEHGGDKITKEEIEEIMRGANMNKIVKKPARSSGGTDYKDCSPCNIKVPKPNNLELPPLDL